MATSKKLEGYNYEIKDQVPHDYICKQCKYLARHPTIVSCCGECYCKTCVETIRQERQPCPSCAKSDFSSFFQPKYQRIILALQVFCPIKARGCEWTGQLQYAEAHLDPSGDCGYIDINCPNDCQMKVQKNSVDVHLASSCPNRDFICLYCSFRGTHHTVTEEHYEVCAYYPLRCPNLCGVTCEREIMEHHMSICRLENVSCEFGCKIGYPRDDQEQHLAQNTQKHLVLIAASLHKQEHDFELKLKQQQAVFETELKCQQDDFAKKLKKQSDTFEQVKTVDRGTEIAPQKWTNTQNILQRRENYLKEIEQKFNKRCQSLENQLHAKESQLKLLQDKLETQTKALQKQVKHLHFQESITFHHFDTFKLPGGSIESPALYTHPGGYKFKLKIFPNGLDEGKGTHVSVCALALKGDYDSQLKFPVRFIICLQLMNQYRDRDHYTKIIQCEVSESCFTNADSEPERYKASAAEDRTTSIGGAFAGVVNAIFRPENDKFLGAGEDFDDNLSDSYIGAHWTFVHHYALKRNRKTEYLKDDCLVFRITDIDGAEIP